jgi:sodium/potassium-transporting ATPase subunit alpha
VLILCVDLGIDVLPALAFAYQESEMDIMERKPRNQKEEFLVGKKFISHTYF